MKNKNTSERETVSRFAELLRQTFIANIPEDLRPQPERAKTEPFFKGLYDELSIVRKYVVRRQPGRKAPFELYA